MVEVNLINEYYDAYTYDEKQLNLFREYNKTLLKELTKDIPLPLKIEHYARCYDYGYNIKIKSDCSNKYRYLNYCSCMDMGKLKEVLSLIKDICDNNLEQLYRCQYLNDTIAYYEMKLKDVVRNTLTYAKVTDNPDIILDTCEQYIINNIKNNTSKVTFGSKIKSANNKDNTVLPKIAKIMSNHIKSTMIKELLTIN